MKITDDHITALLRKRKEKSTDPKEKEKFQMYIEFLERGQKQAQQIRNWWLPKHLANSVLTEAAIEN